MKQCRKKNLYFFCMNHYKKNFILTKHILHMYQKPQFTLCYFATYKHFITYYQVSSN